MEKPVPASCPAARTGVKAIMGGPFPAAIPPPTLLLLCRSRVGSSQLKATTPVLTKSVPVPMLFHALGVPVESPPHLPPLLWS